MEEEVTAAEKCIEEELLQGGGWKCWEWWTCCLGRRQCGRSGRKLSIAVGENGMCEQWQSLKSEMRRLQSLGSSCCTGCGRAGWIKKWPRAFLTVFLIHGMTGTNSRMQCAAYCLFLESHRAISTLSSSFIAPYFLTSSVSVWWCYPMLCVVFRPALLDSC